MATTNAVPDQATMDAQGGTATISQVTPTGATTPAETTGGNTPQLEEVLPEIKNLALKVGGLKNLAAILANLKDER